MGISVCVWECSCVRECAHVYRYVHVHVPAYVYAFMRVSIESSKLHPSAAQCPAVENKIIGFQDVIEVAEMRTFKGSGFWKK